jgi:hypothetical protein
MIAAVNQMAQELSAWLNQKISTRTRTVKKSLVALILLAASVSASADCTLFSTRNENISTILKKYGGWTFDNFNAVCTKLAQAHARIQINADSGVLANQSFGWAILTVVDAETGVGTSSFGSSYTEVNTYASQDKANELMAEAINNAAQEWSHLDDALASLEQERKKVRAILTSKRG